MSLGSTFTALSSRIFKGSDWQYDFENLQRLFAKRDQNRFSISHRGPSIGIGIGESAAIRVVQIVCNECVRSGNSLRMSGWLAGTGWTTRVAASPFPEFMEGIRSAKSGVEAQRMNIEFVLDLRPAQVDNLDPPILVSSPVLFVFWIVLSKSARDQVGRRQLVFLN